MGDLTLLKEILKQKIQLKAQTIKRQNNTFKSDKKKFYRKLRPKQIIVEKASTRDEIEMFWKKKHEACIKYSMKMQNG